MKLGKVLDDPKIKASVDAFLAKERQVNSPNGLKLGDRTDDADAAQLAQQLGAHPYSQLAKDIGSDTLEGLGDLGAGISDRLNHPIDTLKQAGGAVIDAGAFVADHPLKAALAAAAGVGEGVEGLINTPYHLAQYLARKGAINPSTAEKVFNIPDLGIEKKLGIDGKDAALIRSLGSFLPFGGVGRAATGLGGVAKRGAAMGAYGASQNQNPLVTAAGGALAEAVPNAISGAVKGGASGIQRLKPGNLLKGTARPEEIEQNLRAAQGTKTDLGNILKNRALQRAYENELRDLPFSGAAQTMGETADKVIDQGKGLVEELGADVPKKLKEKDAGAVLKRALIKEHNAAQARKDMAFDATNRRANKENINIQFPNLRSKAESLYRDVTTNKDLAKKTPSKLIAELKEFSTSPESKLKAPTGKVSTLELPTELKESLARERDAQFEKERVKDEEKLNKNDLRRTDILRGRFGEDAYDASMKNKNHEASVYYQLQNALEKDIDSSINTQGSPTLKAMRKRAFDIYKNEFEPFQEHSIKKFTRGEGDTDTLLNTFIKTSQTSDRANLANKLLDRLDSMERKLVTHAYFKNIATKNGKFNPNKLRTEFAKLGPRQKEALIPDGYLRSRFEDYGNLVGANQKGLFPLLNPETGQKMGSPSRYGSLLTGLSVGGKLGTAVGGVPGGIVGSLMGAIAGPAVAGGVGRAGTKFLTSEKVRDRMVSAVLKEMREGETKKSKRNRRIDSVNEKARELSRRIYANSAQNQN